MTENLVKTIGKSQSAWKTLLAGTPTAGWGSKGCVRCVCLCGILKKSAILLLKSQIDINISLLYIYKKKKNDNRKNIKRGSFSFTIFN